MINKEVKNTEQKLYDSVDNDHTALFYVGIYHLYE
jgi:hypothetical protein